jgi:5-methylcytosine-specific restriction endonuclease McrA
VRRAVCARDANRCAFVSKHGRRCEETRFLEFHHVVPRAAGGGATVDNIQLRCRAHNGHEVDLFFGPGKRWVRGMTTRASVTRSGTGDTPSVPSG